MTSAATGTAVQPAVRRGSLPLVSTGSSSVTMRTYSFEKAFFRQIVERLSQCADTDAQIHRHVAFRFQARAVDETPGRDLTDQKLGRLHVFRKRGLIGSHRHTGELIQY